MRAGAGARFGGFLFRGGFVCVVKVNHCYLICTYWKFFFTNQSKYLASAGPQKIFSHKLFPSFAI